MLKTEGDTDDPSSDTDPVDSALPAEMADALAGDADAEALNVVSSSNSFANSSGREAALRKEEFSAPFESSAARAPVV